MDDYPPDLAPEFTDSGAVKTPFDEWWTRVKDRFSTVPEEVARQWLHRHWSHSSFSWLRSSDYIFVQGDISSDRILEIWNTSDETVEEAKEVGAYRATQKFWVRDYMLEHGTFPAPIIVLDNRDNHLEVAANHPTWLKPRPLILVEGHRRYEVAVGLAELGKLQEQLPVWWMRRPKAK